MILKIKKLHPDAALPVYATEGAAAVDLTAIDDGTNTKYGYRAYGTGIAVEIPEGHVGLVYPRSSISDRGLSLCNSVGVVDSDYRGEITFRFQLLWGEHTLTYRRGDRIGQLIIMPLPSVIIEEVDVLTTTSRGVGGYGSTGA